MGKETKIGLTVIILLLGVFGLVVYFKVFRPEPGPTAEALASALGDQQPPAAGDDLNALANGPQVQLSAAADERPPVDIYSKEDADYLADDPPPFQHTEPEQDASARWADPPASSRRGYTNLPPDESIDDRYTDAVDEPDDRYASPAEPFEARARERFGALSDIDAADVTDAIADAVDEAGVSDAVSDAVDETVDAVQGYAEQAIEQIPAIDAERFQVPVDVDAAEVIDDFEAPRVLAPSEPIELTPNPIAAAQGEVTQVDAQEVIDDEPAETEYPPRESADRYAVPATPAPPVRATTAAPGEPLPREPLPREPLPRESFPHESLPRESLSREAPPRNVIEPAPPRRFTQPAAAAPAAGNFQRRDESYTIQPNDNYWRISEKLYGTGAFFKALFEHNRTKFPRADRLRQGDVISAPPIEVLEQTYPDLCPRPQHRQVEQNVMRSVSSRSIPRGGQVYVVEEGDTLFDIARYELGKASRFGEIYELNRDVLGDQTDHLKPGMKLILPATGERESIAREAGGALR